MTEVSKEKVLRLLERLYTLAEEAKDGPEWGLMVDFFTRGREALPELARSITTWHKGSFALQRTFALIEWERTSMAPSGVNMFLNVRYPEYSPTLLPKVLQILEEEGFRIPKR